MIPGRIALVGALAAAVWLALAISGRTADGGTRTLVGVCAAVDNPHPQGLLTRLHADVDGDGYADVVLFNPRGTPCPTLTVQFHKGPRVSLLIKQTGLEPPWPDLGFPPRLLRVVNLGKRAGRAILVETFAGAASESIAVVLVSRKGLTRVAVPVRFGIGNAFLVASIAGAVEAVTCGQPGEIFYSVAADLPARFKGKIVTTVLRVAGGRAAVAGRKQIRSATAQNLRRYGFGQAPFESCRGV